MSKAELRKKAGLSSATFTRLRKMLFVLLKIASVLDYNTGDMMDFAKEAPVNQDNSE